MRNKIVLIGQFPPVITGQSLITQYIYEKLLCWGCSITKISFNQIDGNKALNYFFFYYRFIIECSKNNLIIYLSPARSNLGYLRNFIIILYASFFNNKIVMHYHCGDYDNFLASSNFFVKKTSFYIFKKVAYHIFLSKRLLGNFSKLKLEESKIIIIPNSITSSEPKSDSGFTQLCSVYKIVFMSNLLPSKGYMLLLEALDLLVNKYNIQNVRCDFYGEFLSEDTRSVKDLKRGFEEYIRQNKLSDFVKYNGIVNGVIKQNVLSNSQIFVLPTHYPVEAQPLSVLEALSNNLLVIATEFRAIPDMITDGVTGVLLKSNSADCLAVKIMSVLSNPEEYARIAKAGQKHFYDNFSNTIFDKNIKMFFEKFNVFD
jgi:glycosyltransferase involved in cell wall biosynthesis